MDSYPIMKKKEKKENSIDLNNPEKKEKKKRKNMMMTIDLIGTIHNKANNKKAKKEMMIQNMKRLKMKRTTMKEEMYLAMRMRKMAMEVKTIHLVM